MRRNIFCISVILFLSPSVIFSQTIREPISAIYLGLNTYSTQHVDVFSFTNNQASLAQVQKTSVGIYSERRFLLAEATMYTMAAAFATNKGNFGISLKYDGFTNYHETELGFAYGRSLDKKVDVGIEFNYDGYSIPGYGSNTAIDFEMGAIFHLSDKLNAGIHIYNPVGGNFLKGDEKLPAVYKTGFSYDASDRFFVSAEMEK